MLRCILDWYSRTLLVFRILHRIRPVKTTWTRRKCCQYKYNIDCKHRGKQIRKCASLGPLRPPIRLSNPIHLRCHHHDSLRLSEISPAPNCQAETFSNRQRHVRTNQKPQLLRRNNALLRLRRHVQPHRELRDSPLGNVEHLLPANLAERAVIAAEARFFGRLRKEIQYFDSKSPRRLVWSLGATDNYSPNLPIHFELQLRWHRRAQVAILSKYL